MNLSSAQRPAGGEDEEMAGSRSSSTGRGGRPAGVARPLAGADLLRLQLTCNSLDALVQTGQAGAAAEDQTIARFLTRDLPGLMRRAERQLAARVDMDSEDGRVRLDLLREDHRRLRRLARAAAKAAVDSSSADGLRDAGASADIRRYIAAQRHQLAWYRDNLG